MRLFGMAGVVVFTSLVASCGGDDGDGDGGGNGNGSGCLADGSSFLRSTISGHFTSNLNLGNDIGCGGLAMQGSTDASITLGTGDTQNDPSFILNLSGVTEGQTGTGFSTGLNVSIGGAMAGQWMGTCTTALTSFDEISRESNGTLYKVVGSVSCTDALEPFLPGPGTIRVDTLEFSSALPYTP